jgi:hypothetical protein
LATEKSQGSVAAVPATAVCGAVLDVTADRETLMSVTNTRPGVEIKHRCRASEFSTDQDLCLDS